MKRKFQGLMAREAQIIYGIGLKPNVISILGFILGLLSGMAYWAAGALSTDLSMYRVHLILAFLLLLFSGICDALDGALARIRGEVTVFGGFLDSIIDRYVDSAVLLGLILGGVCDLIWGLLALIGSLLTSYVRARAESSGVMMESIGLVERAERIIIISASSLVEIVWPFLPALRVGIIILAIMSNLTVLQRILYFHKRLPRAERKN
ncbi:MAG: CDP-alcohol phosphatidyltransferase family protein [Candidatus Bathyarchaeia archaeon]